MSQINVNRIKDSNKGAPDFPSGVNVSGITSTVTLGVTNLTATNVNVSGVVTATTLDGNLLATGTPTLGLGVTINASGVNISGVATAGIVSATTLYGNGANLTGIALTIAPLNYNPSINDMKVPEATGIGFTFNQGVKAGSGNVTLSLVSVGSTLVENFSVGSSVTYGDSDYGTTVTISPTSSLDQNTVYALSYPSGAFTSLSGDVSYVGTAYTFKTILQEYTLYTWGSNAYGQLGQNQGTGSWTSGLHSSPTQIPGITWKTFGVHGQSNSDYSKAVIKTDGTLWTWGGNGIGELGQNDLTWRSSPVQIPGTTWAQVIGNRNWTAVKTDGTMWGWGMGEAGRLGLNSQINYSSPTQVGSGTDWSSGNGKLSQGGAGGAIKTDGTLWMWGSNHTGGLGDNSIVFKSSPVQIPGTTWNTISARNTYSFATKTDGTAWVWGRNEGGALGLNQATSVKYSSPVQLPGTTWTDIQIGSTAGYGIKTDGTLWTWGENTYGALGHNNTTLYSSPTQVPGTTWKAFGNSMGERSVAAIKTDGTMWTWGYNHLGQLGHNDKTNYSSPKQVPGTTWNRVKLHGTSGQAIQVLEE